MSDMGFVYKRDEQLMNARRMVSRAQEAMVSWDFRAVNEQINLLAKQLRFMQTHETAEALADIATSKADTAPLAICLAALKAVSQEGQG